MINWGRKVQEEKEKVIFLDSSTFITFPGLEKMLPVSLTQAAVTFKRKHIWQLKLLVFKHIL